MHTLLWKTLEEPLTRLGGVRESSPVEVITELISKGCTEVLEKVQGDFPGGPVVKNPLANAEDMGLISGPVRSHMS